ncbi:hypothetical protein ARMGADRAFT_1029545 [Armillaria gallica]|uniref:Uncharacterized protein n=1 Tax=Armillaria gallica TaxID=47427 RepID=A0A2H3E1M2_ARMGA|nr:hypothetical protein ARMGADRAFT_1029545 [Armillaria gallica]
MSAPPVLPPVPALSSPLSEEWGASPKLIPATPVPSSASRELRKQSSCTFNACVEAANSPTLQPNPKDTKYTIPPETPYPVLMSHIPGMSSTTKLKACAIHNTAIIASKAEACLSEKFDAIMKEIKVLEMQRDHGGVSLPCEFLDCLAEALQVLKDIHMEMLAVALSTDLVTCLDELSEAVGTLLNMSPNPHMLQELFASSEHVEDAVGHLEMDGTHLHGRLDQWHAWANDHSRNISSLKCDLNIKFGTIHAAIDGLHSSTSKSAAPLAPLPAPESAIIYLSPVTWVTNALCYNGKALTGSVSALIQSHSAKPTILSHITLHNCFYTVFHFKEHRGPCLLIEKWQKGSAQGFKDVTASTTSLLVLYIQKLF